ncbi:MAG: bifunctional folylpolyglutamate synthase/dihydrofolate synthase [Firmicutes bacterium HGW-Firmicutes-21]|nr:MAG: bifunctional folylpolyglutamate synthase/dihydrofolate synthase [Firmicutes bacterium HGW-Firmicutes-21]
MNYKQAIKYIHSVNWRGSKLGLSRTKELLSKMDNPDKKLRFVHIAGTNGKGSVSAMLASVLEEAGYKVGLYTSPYIVSFNERMQINGNSITNDELAELTTHISQFADVMSDPPTEFELITALAFEFFYRNSCDIVVLETGLGGLLDSTNVIETPELAVITTIDYDHTRELGTTMPEIASAKAGIIKNNGNVLFYGDNKEAEAVIREKCNEENATLDIPDFKELIKKEISLDRLTFDFGKHKNISIPLVGIYQFNNAALVLSAIDILNKKGRKISTRAVYDGMASVKWQGRFEVLSREPLFISDGGHNPQGVASAIESFKVHLPGRKAIFILGIMADKNIEVMIEPIVPFASEFITVTPDNPRSMPANTLKEHLLKYGLSVTDCTTVEEGVITAYNRAGKEGVVFSLGSLYLYREVLTAVKAMGG